MPPLFLLAWLVHLCEDASVHPHDGAINSMSDGQSNKPEETPQRIRLTVQLTLSAYHAISQIQHQHRARWGRAVPIWKVIDTAVRAHAKKQGIAVGD